MAKIIAKKIPYEMAGDNVKIITTGMFSITLDSVRGVAQVQSVYDPPVYDGYELVLAEIVNFNSAELSASQIPPTCIFYIAGRTVFILGTPNKTYTVDIAYVYIKK